ncbi:MAG: hypothetical protein H6708_05780 [Kofleriaceae bacterium]|nr:hypothetical protein [Kofleriaceae bacterium]
MRRVPDPSPSPNPALAPLEALHAALAARWPVSPVARDLTVGHWEDLAAGIAPLDAGASFRCEVGPRTVWVTARFAWPAGPLGAVELSGPGDAAAGAAAAPWRRAWTIDPASPAATVAAIVAAVAALAAIGSG